MRAKTDVPPNVHNSARKIQCTIKMAGGIYKDAPFVLNPKCIIFATFIVILYWIASIMGKVFYWMFPLLFITSYISMAWYDYKYDCNVKLGSGTMGIDATFKPQYDSFIESKNKSTFLFHLIVLPIIIYAGLIGYMANDKGIFVFITGLSVLGLIYHGGKLLTVNSKKNTNDVVIQ